MNKSEAKQYAHRFIAGILEQQLYGKGSMPIDPLVYDWPFGDNEGKRLSDKDYDRVLDALEAMTIDHQKKGDLKNIENRKMKVVFPNVDGKPGSMWGGYKDQRKRQGYSKT